MTTVTDHSLAEGRASGPLSQPERPLFGAHGIRRVQTLFVNCYLVDGPGDSWALVDAGLPGFSALIKRHAERYHGSTPPSAILLTHGHFDHVGSALELAEHWNVPIFCHRLEAPYLTGRSDYPPQL